MEGLKYFIAVAIIISQTTQLCYAKPSYGGVSMPENCKGRTFCFDKPTNYPYKIIETLLNDTAGVFVEATEPVGDRSGVEIPPNECVPIRRSSPIYQIVDEDGLLRYVVQSEKMFMQIVKTEECREPGPITRKTRNLSTEQVSMFKFTCKEKKLDFKFVVLSMDGSGLEAVRVKGGVPVCCSCERDED